MTRILFDLHTTQPIGSNMFHGGSEYTKAVFIKLMENIDMQKQSIEVFYDYELGLDETISKILDGIQSYDCKTSKELEKVISNNHYDVLYSGLPDFCLGINIPTETKFIYTLHGLRNIEKPYDSLMFEYLPLNIHNRLKKLSIKLIPRYWEKKYYRMTKELLEITSNREILTVSNHSKFSLIVNYPELKQEELKVFYSPNKFLFIDEKDAEYRIKRYKIDRPYFLMVSAARWQKNNLRAVIAFDQLFTNNETNLHNSIVVLTGVTDKEVFLKHIKNKDRFVLLEYVDTLDLEALYRKAHAFVYPTLNEGFGYPPVEAMKYGTLSLCSNVTSIPEVCGDAVIYFNPYDVMEIKNRILQSFDEKIVTDKRSKMKEQFELIDKAQKEALVGIVNEIISE